MSSASPATITFQSRIYKPDGTPLESPSVNFRFTTLDSSGTCILYVEDFLAHQHVTHVQRRNRQLEYSGKLVWWACSRNQTLTASSALPTGNVTVATTAGAKLILGSNASFNGASQNLSLTLGSINMAGYNFTLKGLALNANTITKNAGVLTVNESVAGTGSLYGGTVAP